MSNKDFYNLWAAALAKDDRDMYVEEWSTCSIWGMTESLTDGDLLCAREYCGKLWTAAHMTVKEIKEYTGMSQIKFAERFCIPRRTIEAWCAQDRECPNYTRLMMMEALGIVTRSV